MEGRQGTGDTAEGGTGRRAAHPSAGTPGSRFFMTRVWEVGPDGFHALMEVTVGQRGAKKRLWVAVSQVRDPGAGWGWRSLGHFGPTLDTDPEVGHWHTAAWMVSRGPSGSPP